MKIKTYLLNILISFDQLVNVLFLGQPDETISSRAWRCKDANSFWKVMHSLINKLFFFQKDHCFNAYLAEVERKQIITEIIKRNNN